MSCVEIWECFSWLWSIITSWLINSENVICLLLKDPIVSASLQLNRRSVIQSRTLKRPIAAPASKDHHTIVAFKEKASVKHAPLTFSS